MNKLIYCILLLIIALSSKAQWECPSKLAAHLDPIAESPVLVGLESQLSTGVLDENSINTAMLFAGIDYSKNNHSFYFEGGFKAWWKYDTDKELLFDQYRFGFREFFYQYTNKLSSLTLGLQSSTFDDHYLLNERIAGINYKLDFGKWKLNSYGGSVTKDFARNGIFCTTGFIYDLPTGQEATLLGNKLGDKNLAGFTFTFFPEKENKKQKPISITDDFEAFDSNEFGDFEPLVNNSKPERQAIIKLEQIGIAGYAEFGNWIDSSFFQTGAFASVKLPGNIYFNPEILFQIESTNKGIIYLASLERSFSLSKSSRLSLGAAYYAFSAIDNGAAVLNSYSNILAGEVLRLDAINMPLYLLSAKFNVPTTRFHIKLQKAGQANSGNLNEWDIEIGKQLFNRLNINTKASVIKGGALENKVFLARLEARFYF